MKANKRFICVYIKDKENPADAKKDTCCSTTMRIFNVFIKLIFLGILALLCMGAYEIGVSTLIYRPRGQFLTVPLSDNSNRTLKIHYICEGGTNASKNLPTFVFEGDGAHSHADYLGLQRLLTKAGRRSCIWDKAGLGYSDFLYADMLAPANYSSLYYNRFLRALVARGERAPFVWVAWGGGGSFVYSYALQQPDMVKSITYLDAYPPQFEWTSVAKLKNYTIDQTKSFIDRDMIYRYPTQKTITLQHDSNL